MAKPNKFDGLMHDLCVGWGFCGCATKDGRPLHVTNFIPEKGMVSADQFAEWVVQADWPGDLNDADYASYQSKWTERIAELFNKHMGADWADASELKWDFSRG